MKSEIYVTQPSLPPLEEFIPYLEKIWVSKVLTNGGQFHQQLEAELCRYLGVPYISLFNNGTNALLTALQALELSGEVITTPFSFVATANSIVWNGLKPVFVDVEPTTLNLNPEKIEEAITEKTTAIMPVHCYGRSCKTDIIQKIATNHKLKVIYDAAHAFGVRDQGGSILRHGNLSVLSFHATKVFNTFEGGAIVAHDLETKTKVDQLKNFGIQNEETVEIAGLNGKMNEVCAAFGLVQLKHIGESFSRRQEIDELYRNHLIDIRGIKPLPFGGEKTPNFSYFPVIVESDFGVSRDELNQALKSHGIHPRRYFYPLISNFGAFRDLPSSRADGLPVANEMAKRILCLPIYPSLDDAQIERVVGVIKGAKR